MADPVQPQKTDPHLRFDLFKKAEGRLLENLREHEREIKRLMAELETIRNLLEEASDDIEEKDQERLENERERVEEQRRALEEVVNESSEMRREGENERQAQELPDNYTPVTAQRLTMAASYSTRQELYQLQNKEEWTPDDAYRFFEISNAVQTTQQYSFSAPIQENITQTYDLIRNVADQQRNQIEMNYDSSLADRIQTYQSPTTSSQFSASSTADNRPQSPDITQNYTTLDTQLSPEPNTQHTGSIPQNPEPSTADNTLDTSEDLKNKYKPNKLDLDKES
ncbi:MAG: hypothetical protein ACQESE_01595 [Nanobdellota archaeon]